MKCINKVPKLSRSSLAREHQVWRTSRRDGYNHGECLWKGADLGDGLPPAHTWRSPTPRMHWGKCRSRHFPPVHWRKHCKHEWVCAECDSTPAKPLNASLFKCERWWAVWGSTWTLSSLMLLVNLQWEILNLKSYAMSSRLIRTQRVIFLLSS